jgi:general stress protein 26
MSRTPHAATVEPKSKILELLDENRLMTVATIRRDGWPQATMVGYMHDDLTLYFTVARVSQKLSNIQRDPRISIALGHDEPNRLRGLSMAAHAAEITDCAQIDHLNRTIVNRYPEQRIFFPRDVSVAVIRATPTFVSIIDLAKGPGEPELFQLSSETTVIHVKNKEAKTISDQEQGPYSNINETVLVHYTHWEPDANRPGAPP